MWLFECEGDVLDGKRVWLRPGSKYCLGRVKCEEVNMAFESQRSISRIHLEINVSEVLEGDGAKLHHRSVITVTDLKTKHGTKIDGESIKGQTRTLEGDTHKLHLGLYAPAFKISWNPVVFFVSLTNKERNKTMPNLYREKMEAFDIKVATAWVPAATHVVVSKRNTPPGLRALINGKYIVASSYLDAVAEAAKKPEKDKASPLEMDFDKNWPKPEDYLPPHKNEPVHRPPEMYRPDKRRQNLFSGYVFVFCEKVQYEHFLGPITDGHGKLKEFELDPERTMAEEVVKFVEKRGQGAKVVVVRFRGKRNQERENQLSTRIQELLGFRMLEQNEFLDIILTCDTSSLRKPLEEDFSSTAPPQISEFSCSTRSTKKNDFHNYLDVEKQADKLMEHNSAEKPLVEETQLNARSRRGRSRVAQSIIEDLFPVDPDGFLPPPRASSVALARDESSKSSAETARHMSPVLSKDVNASDFGTSHTRNKLSTVIEKDEVQSFPSQKLVTLTVFQNQRAASKRRAPLLDPEEGSLDVMDLLPGARAVKRRKQEEEAERLERGESIVPETPPPEQPDEAQDQNPPSKPKRSVNPKKGQKKKAEIEDPTALSVIKDEEDMASLKAVKEERVAMDALDVGCLKNLGTVGIFEIQPRTDKPARDAYGDQSSTWNPKWNGMKNFKKFSRAGRGGAMRTIGDCVMVNLEEHVTRAPGTEDGFWFEGDENSRKRNSDEMATAQQAEDSQSRRNTDAPYSTSQSQLSDSEDWNFGHGSRHSTAAASNSGTRAEVVAAVQGTKRSQPAMGGRAESKRQRTLIITDSNSSDEDSGDDELKFKFKRK
ncbi:hypothetical protein RUND412_003765 [Rhizina undulata]